MKWGRGKKSDHVWSGWGAVGNDTLITVIYTLWLFWPIVTRWDCPLLDCLFLGRWKTASVLCGLLSDVLSWKEKNKTNLKLNFLDAPRLCAVVLYSLLIGYYIYCPQSKGYRDFVEKVPRTTTFCTSLKKMLFIKSQVIAVKCKYIFTKSRLTKRIYRISCSPWYHCSDKIIQKTGESRKNEHLGNELLAVKTKIKRTIQKDS